MSKLKRITSNLDLAVEHLRSGRIVSIPTETVYGLAGRIFSHSAIENIFKTKARPFFDPLIVHISSIEQAQSYAAEWPESAQFLADEFWPGPLTIVLKKNDDISEMITSSHDSVGLRMPSHLLTREIIQNLGEGIAAPSANRFGKLSPTSAQDVIDEFPNDDFLVVDGGQCSIGIESTVLRISENHIQILRPGMIGKEQIETCLKKLDSNLSISVEIVESEVSPGHLDNHYQPDIPLLIFSNPEARPWSLNWIKENISALGYSFSQIEQLSLSQDPTIAARSIYSQMRCLQSGGANLIYFVEGPEHLGPEWLAIRNRLYKASSQIIKTIGV